MWLAAKKFFFSVFMLLPSLALSNDFLNQIQVGDSLNQLGRLQDCFHFKTNKFSNRKAKLTITKDESFSSWHENVKTEVSGKLDLGIIGGSASVRLASILSENQLKSSLVVSFRAELGRIEIDHDNESVLSEREIEDLRAACGTRIVQAIDYGLDFHAVIQVHFKNREARRDFRAKIKIKALFGLIKGEKTIDKNLLKEFDNSVLISIDVIQTGGDQRAVSRLKNQIENLPCRPSRIENCQKAYGDIFKYLRDDLREYLLNQKKLVSLNPIRIHLAPIDDYLAIRSDIPTSVLNDEPILYEDLQILRQRLYSSLKKIYQIKRRLSLILASNPSLQNTLYPALLGLEEEINQIESVLADCFLFSKSCQERLKRTLDEIQWPEDSYATIW